MKRLGTAAREHLERSILPFWMSIRDEEFGGYFGFMSQELDLDRKWEKGCILNSRILWFFSQGAMTLHRPELRSFADHAYRYMTEHCLDRVNGGIYWNTTYYGNPLETTKYTYNQAFAIYALSAYYRLTGKQDALDEAMALFRVIEEKCTDEVGYLEAQSADWHECTNEHISANGLQPKKTMNTLLHVFEGYSGLYAATHDETVRRAMVRILGIFSEKMYDRVNHCQFVHFDENYNSILDVTSYGHDIEASWLMDWGCDLLGEPQLSEKIHKITFDVGKHAFEMAYENHSFANECDRGHWDETRVWWVQAEAEVGLVHLLEKQPDNENFRQAAADLFRFIEDYLEDKRPGSEWFYSVDKTGNVTLGKPILEPWKCPYHNGRMCLELIRRDPEVMV